MRLFRVFHFFIIAFLSLVVLASMYSTIIFLQHPQEVQKAQMHLESLLERPPTLTSAFTETPKDYIIASFGPTHASIESDSLMRRVSDGEELFIPLLTAPKLNNLQFVASPLQRTPPTAWDEMKIRAWVASVAATIDTHAVPPSAAYVPRAQPPFKIFEGKSGVGIDIEASVSRILHSPNPSYSFELPSITVAPPLTPDAIIASEERMGKLIGLKLVFTAKERTFTLTPRDIVSLVALPTGFSESAAKNLVATWAKDFDVKTVEPELAFDGKTIRTFRAPVDGRSLDEEKNTHLLLSSLQAFEETGDSQSKELVVTTTAPKITLTSLNSLGITEQIGRGESEYHHSIPNRVHNVALTTSHIHGHIVMPGETFSFNNALGEVSAATGFLQAYVIKEGQTVLGDGGGVCQVSSTLFRAILDAGLPVLERRGHSYRVGYYEQNSKPGFDATVFSPHPDLIFLNDTSAPILINAQADSKNVHMYIELYGKKDGRKAEILNYRQWDTTAAPPTVYQDDPTLPKGTLKQIDFAAGGLKTSFTYKVTYPNGDIKEHTYQTNYIPWRAVYLRGTR